MTVSLPGARRATIAAIVTVLALGTSAPAQASSANKLAPAPPSDRVTVEVVTVNGSGCPAGTAAVAAASDNTAFTVTYSDYLAEAGAGSDPTDFRKNCQLNLLIRIPQGFTYAIAKADYRGFASLANGATALQRANYYFAGQSATTAVNHNLRGPMSDSWQFTDVTESASLVWAPCGATRNLNVNTELRVRAGTVSSANSFIAMDSTDGSIRTVYHFSWKSC